jgi:hypothetical protein
MSSDNLATELLEKIEPPVRAVFLFVRTFLSGVTSLSLCVGVGVCLTLLTPVLTFLAAGDAPAPTPTPPVPF